MILTLDTDDLQQVDAFTAEIAEHETAARLAKNRLDAMLAAKAPYKPGDLITIKRKIGNNIVHRVARITSANPHLSPAFTDRPRTLSFTYTIHWWLKKEQDWDGMSDGTDERDISGYAPADGPWAS